MRNGLNIDPSFKFGPGVWMLNRSTGPNEQSKLRLGLQETRVIEPRAADCRRCWLVLLREGRSHKTSEGGTKPIRRVLQRQLPAGRDIGTPLLCFLSGRKTIAFVSGVRAWAGLCQLARLGRQVTFGIISAKVDAKHIDRKEMLLLSKGKDEGQVDFFF